MFNIEINNSPKEVFGEQVYPSKIVINDFCEWINIPVVYWDIEQYKDSWKKSIKYGLETKEHAALIVSMYDPDNLNFISTWTLYFVNELVYIQNKLIFVNEYNNFDVNNINDFISNREIYNEDGVRISEWQCTVEDIIEFYHSL